MFSQPVPKQQNDTARRSLPTTSEPEVWVKKWVDYSSKYGLGYLLSNNANGVFFNDSTKIIMDPKGFHFDFLERKQADKQDIMTSYNV